jgi:hypothetical protein
MTARAALPCVGSCRSKAGMDMDWRYSSALQLGRVSLPRAMDRGSLSAPVDHTVRGPHDRGYHWCMRSLRVSSIISALLLGATACGAPYDPPVKGDHSSEQYRADLEKCRITSKESVRLKNADTPQSWIISPFTGPPAVRAAIRTCMAAKGYALAKPED